MGLEQETQGSSVVFCYLANSNKTDEKKGIYYLDNNKQKQFIGAISGEIVGITKELRKPKEGGARFSPYWAYYIEFEDKNSDPSNIKLQLRRGNDITEVIINSLASVEHPRAVKVGGYTNKHGRLAVYVKDHLDQRIDWKFPYDPNIKGFAGVPEAVWKDSEEIDDVTGEPKRIKLSKERDDFFELQLAKIYETFTGQKWSASNVVGDNAANPSNKPSGPISMHDQIMAMVKTSTTTTDLLGRWPKLSSYIQSQIQDKNDQNTTRAAVQEYLASLGDRYILAWDGTFTPDDLPF